MDRSKIKTVLTIDPAASTGYCVGHIDNDTFDIFEYGFLDVNIETDCIGDRCIDLMQQIAVLIDRHSVDHIGVEDFFFSQRSAQGSTVNAAYRTAIHILTRQKGLEYTILNIGAWKKLVAGRATSTKEQKAKWGKEASKKLMTQEALWKNYGFIFPNHSISKLTGKPIKFRYDIVDAVAQAVYLARVYLDVQKVQLSVKAPPDADFGKRKPRTLFDYSEVL